MNTARAYNVSLYKGSKKGLCAGCGRKTAVVYVNNETGEFFPDHVARCDRENNCGYHYTPKQYFAETGHVREYKPFIQTSKPEPIVPVEYLPLTYLEQAAPYCRQSNFYKFLESLFGTQVAKALCLEYLIMPAKFWKGAAVFPQIDIHGNLCQLKIMLHDAITGKRVKEGATVEQFNRRTSCYETIVTETSCSRIYGKFIDDKTKALNLQQTFFGAHLLTEYPEKPVCVVESEKTAVIASVYMPQFVWIATGGASGCKWREYEVYKNFRGRSVTFFPDYGLFNKKTGRTCFEEWTERVERISEVLKGNIRVSDLLEKRLRHIERNDQDLADLLLQRDGKTGLALTEAGYPVIFDFNHAVL